MKRRSGGEDQINYESKRAQDRGERMRYLYGMRLRGFSPGCQPMTGLVDVDYDESGRFYDILIYDRQLTDQELRDYELTEVGESED